jgi:4-alpha-glucanotransferase
MRKVHAEYDGLRVDHPQGWVSPWVYRTDIADPFESVQNGARLFASPDLPDHPALREFAITRPDQLNRDVHRHSDNWVRELTEEQVTRYATLFTRLAPRGIEGQHEVMCEVLSTMPAPLRWVMDRYGLGRFRVLQNADPNDPYDVYRSDNAKPSDWIMLGNHDTPPIWWLAENWCANGEARDRATDLASRLIPEQDQRPAWIEQCVSDPGMLVHALFADMLHSKARNIMVFVSDMLGVTERYNTPGTISDDNWSLRVPPDFEEFYLRRIVENKALSLPFAMLLALRARPGEVSEDLLRRVEGEVERLQARGSALGAPKA